MTLINELDGFMIRFDGPEQPSGNRFYFNNRLMVALQQVDGAAPQWNSLSCTTMWEYSLIGGLCKDRCIEAEHGRLLVNGKKISPENYLRLWENRAKECITVAQAAARGFGLIEVICRSKASFRKAEDEAALRPFLVSQVDQLITWRIPLISPEHLALMDIVGYDMDYDYRAGESANTRRTELNVEAPLQTGSNSSVKTAQAGLFDLEVTA